MDWNGWKTRCTREGTVRKNRDHPLAPPAAALPGLALHSGARLIEINAEATPLTPYAEAAVRGAAGEILPIIERALGSRGE
jgi:hypothetical protein